MTRHPFDWQGLTFGLVALTLAGWWVLRESAVATPTLALVLPVALILAGVVGLAVSLAGSRRRRPAPTDPPSGHEPSHDETSHEDTKEIR